MAARLGACARTGDGPLPAQALRARDRHAVPRQRDRVHGRAAACRATSAATFSGASRRRQSVNAYNHALGVDRPIYAQYASWISKFVQGNLGMLARVQGADLVAARAVAAQLARARRGRVRARRAAEHPRRRRRGAAARPHRGPRDHADRALADRDARVRLRDHPDPRLRAAVQGAAGQRHGAARVGLLHPREVPAAAGDGVDDGAVRLHRADGARRHDRGARRRLHPHGVPQGHSARGR